jgi:hypothetical protein
MAQKSQIIDITKSYTPGDPNQIPENLVSTNKEDVKEEMLPVIPYDGYNFLPTAYGYRSYFGINSAMGINDLTSRCQHIIPFQLPNRKTILIALCEDGIWTVDASGANSWVHTIVHTFNANVFEMWTYAIIENTIYFYKQGRGEVYHTFINGTAILEIHDMVPSFLNLAGQIGIFKANTRLGFWDSENSTSWSSNLDLEDFEPDSETLAGNCIFADVTGKIVKVMQHGTGFLIYSTKSIVGVQQELSGNLLWSSNLILASTGISHPRAVVTGAQDAHHYVYTTSGILVIGPYSSINYRYDKEFIFPEVFDFFRESRTPIYLSLIQKRFLCFHMFDADYIYSATSFQGVGIPDKTTKLILADGYWSGDVTVLPTILDGNSVISLMAQVYYDALKGTGFSSSCIVY